MNWKAQPGRYVATAIAKLKAARAELEAAKRAQGIGNPCGANLPRGTGRVLAAVDAEFEAWHAARAAGASIAELAAV